MIFWHCEIIKGMSERVGMGAVRIRWWWFLAVRHQVYLGRRSTSPIFPEPFWDLSLVFRLVDFGSVIHDVFGSLFSNSAFYIDGVFCAPNVCSLYLSSGWWPVLRRPTLDSWTMSGKWSKNVRLWAVVLSIQM